MRCPVLPGVVWRKWTSISDHLRILHMLFIYLFVFFANFYFPASGQAVVTGVVPSPPRFLPSIFIAHRVQQSHCSAMFRVLLTHALALSASQLIGDGFVSTTNTSIRPGRDIYQPTTYSTPWKLQTGHSYGTGSKTESHADTVTLCRPHQATSA